MGSSCSTGAKANAHKPGAAPPSNSKDVPELEEQSANVLQETDAAVKRADAVRAHAEKGQCTLDVLQTQLPVLMEQFDNLQQFDSDRLGGTAFQLLQDVKEVVSVVAHVTVPPPGGQIIAAAIQLTVLVIDGAKNIGVCQRLAQRCNRMVHQVYGRGQGESTMLKAPESLQQSLDRLKDVCIEVITFVEEIVNQNWFQRLWECKTTAQRLEELNNELTLAQGELQTALGRAAYDSNAKAQLVIDELKDDVRTIRDGGQRAEAVLCRYGTAENVLKGKEALEELKDAAKGMDGVMLQLHLEGHEKLESVLCSVKSLLESKAADQESGAHKYIQHDVLKTLWQRLFASEEKIGWQEFFAVFPVSAPHVDEQEIQLLEKELDDHGQKQLRIVCDSDMDDKLSARELGEHFPRSVSLVQQVRNLKSIKKGLRDDLPAGPPRLHGRAQQVRMVCDLISPPDGVRAVMLVGGPGEGKRSVAIKALKQLFEDKKAIGGLWGCTMGNLQSEQDLIRRLINGLSHNHKPVDAKEGLESSLRAVLAEVDSRNMDTYLLVDDCECIITSPDLCDAFQNLLVQLLRMVRRLRLVLTSRENHMFTTVEDALGSPLKVVQLPALSDGDGAQILQDRWAGSEDGRQLQHLGSATQQDAELISRAFHANPLMLRIVGDGLRLRHMTLDQAKSGLGLADAAYGNKTLGQELDRVQRSMMRSLDGLPPDFKSLALRIAIVLPGTISAKVVSDVFSLSLRRAQQVLQCLSSSSLLEELGGPANVYQVNAMLRQTAQSLCEDASASKHGIAKAELQTSWVSFASYCLQLVEKDFEAYRFTPELAFADMLSHSSFINHVLRSVAHDKELASSCIGACLSMLSYLPLVPAVLDAEVVQAACDTLQKVALAGGSASSGAYSTASAGAAVCLAVKATFAAARTPAQQQQVLPIVMEALLQGSYHPANPLILAAALRRKGIVSRDLGSSVSGTDAAAEAERNELFAQSISALTEAAQVVKASGLTIGQAKMEHILCLAELAGSLDYVGHIDKGQTTAEEALQMSRAFFGTKHPVVALCLTTLGYFLKARGNIESAAEALHLKAAAEGNAEQAASAASKAQRAHAKATQYHQQAIDCHSQAKVVRIDVLGPNHLEVALSFQQEAISMKELGWYQEADAALQESLRIRKMNLKPDHSMLTNTYKRMRELYIAWDKPDKAAECLSRLESIRIKAQ